MEPRLSVSWNVVFVGTAAAYSWWVAGLRPFTVPVEILVSLVVAVVAVEAWWHRDPSPRRGVAWRDARPWLLLVFVVVAIELEAFVSAPRRAHPTLSSLADAMMNSHPTRAAMCLAWIMLGHAMFRRRSFRTQR